MNIPESPNSPEGGGSLDGKAIPRFECPPSFQRVELSAEDEPLFLEDTQGATELWLIKTPHNFDAKRLNAMNISLSGRQFLNETEVSDRSYELLASRNAPSDKERLPHLLLPSKRGANLKPAPPFNGQLSVMETIAIPPVLLPPSPPPKSNELPPGLKQRFLPFGWEEPKKQIIWSKSADATDSGISHSKRKKKSSHKDKKLKKQAAVSGSSEVAGRPARQGKVEQLVCPGEAADEEDGAVKEHRKSKKRKGHHVAQEDDATNQSQAKAEETQQKKKKKPKH